MQNKLKSLPLGLPMTLASVGTLVTLFAGKRLHPGFGAVWTALSVWHAWQHRKKMQADVRKNGIVIDAISSTGKAYQKENPAVKLAMLYNKQKLAILKQLEIVPSTVIDPDESEEFADL